MSADAEDLPKANVKRIIGAKLTEFHEHFAAEDRKGRAVQINKDALEAFVQSAKIFIHYLSATANEICQENRRSTVNAEDVIKALEELEFDDLIEPLKEALDLLRNEAQVQKSKKKAAPKKRKAAEEQPEGAGAAGKADNEEGQKPLQQETEAKDEEVREQDPIPE